MNPSRPETARGEFVRLFNEGRFFEAHEALEPLWRKSEGGDRLFYQGLIQIAVALHHLKLGNPEGAQYESALAREKLGSFPPKFLGIDIAKLIEESETCLKAGNVKNPPKILPGS